MAVVNSTYIRQTDGRWGDYAFCPGGKLYTHGCGPLSISIVLGHDTPYWAADFLTQNGYASSEYGTDHYGIIAAIKAAGYGCWYGGTSLNGVMSSQCFSALEAHVKAGYKAILLMGGPNSGGGACRTNYFCNAGHYIAITGHIDGKLQCIDPAFAARDGYHSIVDTAGAFADSYNGNIKYIYLTTIPWKEIGSETPSDVYQLTLPQIKITSTGNAVLLWEEFMTAEGYYDGEQDKAFGPKLQKATITYQKATGLTADGVVGPNTWQKAFGITGTVSGSKVTFSLKQVKGGDTGKYVLWIQMVLKARGMYSGKLDKQAGGGTVAGIIAYQKARGLTADGIAGPNTMHDMTGM